MDGAWTRGQEVGPGDLVAGRCGRHGSADLGRRERHVVDTKVVDQPVLEAAVSEARAERQRRRLRPASRRPALS